MAQYKSLKAALENPVDVTMLKLKHKKEDFPLDLFKLPNLTTLYLQLDKTKELIDQFEKLPNLVNLYIQAPSVTTIPKTIIEHEKIETLNLSTSPITSFEITPSSKTNIKNIFLNKSGLEKIPLNLEFIESLELLNLASNKLTEFDFKILFLKNLKKLNLDGNQIKKIPCEKIQKNLNLHQISLDNNLFSEEEKQSIHNLLGYIFGEI